MNNVDEFIEHFGKRGMRWGSRRAVKKTGKADKKWEKKANTIKTFVAVNNVAAGKANKIDVPRINNNPRYKGKDFTFDSPLRREYYKAHEDAFNKRRQEAVNQIVGTNPSGTKKIKIYSDGSAGFVKVQHSIVNIVDSDYIEHADDEGKIVLIFDDLGNIIKFSIEEVIEQSDLVDNFLEHYGKKGMRWGSRKSGGISKTVKKKTSAKPKAKDLSDEDLKKAVNRMQMERQYTSLVKGSSSRKSADFVKSIGTTAVKTAVTAVATQQVSSVLKKAKIAK